MISVGDFFAEETDPRFDAVVGNPPYVRYQGWTGDSRVRSREAALRGGVRLTQLASSWAAFTVHSALFLRPGGRLALVLPAELLSVNYAAPVRDFLFRSFQSVDLVLFTERVFPEAEADVVVLLAEGFGTGSTDHATVYQVQNSGDLNRLGTPRRWQPADPSAKWTGAVASDEALRQIDSALGTGVFEALTRGETPLSAWSPEQTATSL
jgi:hypothetical protein